MTSSKRMTFSLDNDICNGLVQWTSVVVVSVLASYVSGFLFVRVNQGSSMLFVRGPHKLIKNISSAGHGRPQKFFQGGNVDILLIIFELLTMQREWTFTKGFTLSASTKEMPHVSVSITKMRFVGSNGPVYYDNLHSWLCAHFQRRVLLYK